MLGGIIRFARSEIRLVRVREVAALIVMECKAVFGKSSLSLRTIASGVPIGATSAYQPLGLKPGKVSATVGKSGKSANRLAAPTASALMEPACNGAGPCPFGRRAGLGRRTTRCPLGESSPLGLGEVFGSPLQIRTADVRP